MVKHLLILPDGTEVFSAPSGNAIKKVSLTETVNSGTELTLGSVCAALLEATLITPGGDLHIESGSEVILCTVTEDGTRTQDGVFILEKPTRPSANSLKLTGYDRISKLDKELTQWLSNLDGWPYALRTFAGMVCEACGLTLATEDVPNGDYPVRRFTRTKVTGRQLLQWVGVLCCRFVRATPTGEIELAWYRKTEKQLTAQGENYYFAGTFAYEDYQTAPVDIVQLRMSDTEGGALLPLAEDGANAYIIEFNPLLSGSFEADIQPVLETVCQQLHSVTYTPCKVACRANQNIRAGDIVTVTDKNGATITAYVMTMTRTGNRETLECTGSVRRDTSTSVNTQSTSDTAAQAAKETFASLTQEQIFAKLTNNGEAQGVFIQDGQLYVNASYLKAGIIEGIKIIGEEGSIGGFEISDHSLSTAYRKEFGEFTQDDLTTITEIFASGSATEEQLDKYDLNMDGKITASDAVIMANMINGTIPNYTEGKITIDATNPKAYVCIEVTAGYRAGEVIRLGSGGVIANKIDGETFYRNGVAGYSGEVAVGDATLTIRGGIITGVS